MPAPRSPSKWIVAMTVLLVLDLAANAGAFFVPRSPGMLVVLTGVSALSALFSHVLLVLVSMETTAFRAGFSTMVCAKFSRVYLLAAVYLVLCIVLGVLVLVLLSGRNEMK